VRRAIVPLTAGALLAIAIVGVYAVAYLHARDRVGEREPEQIRIFSARPTDYLVTAEGNWLYGKWQEPSNQERRLFPGAVPILLAIVAVLLRVPSRIMVAYVLGLVAAFEASLGFRGYVYAFLFDHLSAFHALRAPARLGIFVVFFVAVMAGFGYRYLTNALGARARVTLLVVLTATVLVEYFTALTVVAYPNTPPPVYKLLAAQPPGVVAEMPMPKANALPGWDAKYAYMSIFHWKPLLNGYSGFYPPTYIRRLLDVRRFPEPFALRVLRQDGARYIVVHERGYGDDRAAYENVLATLDASADVLDLGRFSDGDGDATVYVFRRGGE